jgi:hypothetical protein
MTDNPHYVTPEQADRMTCVVNPAETFCNGPDCMAWRWRHMRYENEKDPETGAWPAVYSTTHGYCGMART